MSKKNINNPIPQSLRFAALAVDVVCFRVVDKRLEVLLGKVVSKNNAFYNSWAHIGGLIHIKETADQAVERLLHDKAGISSIYKEQLYTFSEVQRDPRGRVVSVAYIALTTEDKTEDIKKGSVQTMWCPIDSLPKLGYDHDDITRVALERLQNRIQYTDIARHLISKEFTLTDLQTIYEVVLGEDMDKRNFRKKMMSLNILKETKRTIKKGVMRPAQLYVFK